ncbi:MAG: hypothetical protein J7465_18030 [Chloroflexus sp.]|nr:hypothetical protein [Chloroflexus sp.]MBO9371900.1 hypothetical protein [Chloroflexus sp.]
MSRAEVLIITEGATEREVGNVLYQKGILHNGLTPRLPSGIRPREGYDAVVDILTRANPLLGLLSTGGNVLFVLDQEDSPTPLDRKDQFLSDLQQRDTVGFWISISFAPSPVYGNIFEHYADGLHLVLHISDAIVPGISRRDFDGYILNILQNPVVNQQVVSRIVATGQNCQRLLQKAEIEFTNLMASNGYRWTHAKSWLYAYITAFQYRGSHVWFARDVVTHTPDSELRWVFASLIAAWDRF